MNASGGMVQCLERMLLHANCAPYSAFCRLHVLLLLLGDSNTPLGS
jgi:hypothetical protein